MRCTEFERESSPRTPECWEECGRYKPVEKADCDVCWDSHGCGLPEGHGGPVHICLSAAGPCSLILWDDEDGWVRWDDGERVGPVRAFHALAGEPDEVGTP